MGHYASQVLWMSGVGEGILEYIQCSGHKHYFSHQILFVVTLIFSFSLCFYFLILHSLSKVYSIEKEDPILLSQYWVMPIIMVQHVSCIIKQHCGQYSIKCVAKIEEWVRYTPYTFVHTYTLYTCTTKLTYIHTNYTYSLYLLKHIEQICL